MEFNIEELFKLGAILGGLMAHYFIIKGDINILTERQKTTGIHMAKLSRIIEEYKDNHNRCSTRTEEKIHNLEKDTEDIVKKLYDISSK